MVEVLASLVEKPAPAAEIEATRNQGEGRRRMRRLSRIGQAYALSLAEMREKDPRSLDADLPELRAVTAERVAQAAATHLQSEPEHVGIAP
jgi:predicted Zn-dependent peptidase